MHRFPPKRGNRRPDQVSCTVASNQSSGVLAASRHIFCLSVHMLYVLAEVQEPPGSRVGHICSSRLRSEHLNLLSAKHNYSCVVRNPHVDFFHAIITSPFSCSFHIMPAKCAGRAYLHPLSVAKNMLASLSCSDRRETS